MLRAGGYANVFKPRRLRERFLSSPGRIARRTVPRQPEWSAATGGQCFFGCAGHAGAVLLSQKPSLFAGALDRGKLQRTSPDPAGRPGRIDTLCAIAGSTDNTFGAFVVLRPPQTDHAFDQ